MGDRPLNKVILCVMGRGEWCLPGNHHQAEPICGFKMATSEKLQSTNNSKPLKEEVLLYSLIPATVDIFY